MERKGKKREEEKEKNQQKVAVVDGTSQSKLNQKNQRAVN
jgi:hypothetical protein